MPSLSDCWDSSGLIILIAEDEAVALDHLATFVRDQPPPMSLWEWEEGQGVKITYSTDDAAPPQADLAAANVVKAIEVAQRAETSVCLALAGADQLRPANALRRALARQVKEESACWIVLLSAGKDLSALLKDAKVRGELITVDLRQRAQSAAAQAQGRAIDPAMRLEDIEELDKFDTEGWTHKLENLTANELKRIVHDELFVESRARIETLCERLKEIFVQKDDLIDLMSWCSIAHLPMLLLGTWGTGKSFMVRQFSRGLGIKPDERRIATEDQVLADLMQLVKDRQGGAGDLVTEARSQLFHDREARHFEYLVTRFTTPEELLGPVNVEAMLSCAVHLRQTRSLLPRAEIAFLDEVFKANSSILNALLSIVNERLFYNAGMPWKVNLVMLFGASNEPPQEEELGAFLDRFPVRALCDPVSSDKLEHLLDHAHSMHYATLLRDGASGDERTQLGLTGDFAKRQMERVACVNDFRLLRKVCLMKFGGIDVRESSTAGFTKSYLQLFRHLRSEYDISDRSCAHFYRLARAKALMQRRDRLDHKDREVLAYCGKDPEALRHLQGIIEGLG